MQAAANALQEKMGTLPSVARPEYKHREDGSKMQALAWFGNKDVRVVEVPIPDITQEHDVIVQVTGTTICGSDLHLYHSEIMGMQKGDILGHEFMGRVDRVGPAVKNLRVGQRVVASFQIACGECRYCKEKLSSMCNKTNNSSLQQYMYGQKGAGFFGYSHFTGGFPGGQAEYARVPFGDVNLLPIPEDVPDEKALYLSDIIPTAYHCVLDTGVKEGDVVGIWGLGPIGQCVIKWAKLKGASRVIAIDNDPQRLNFAKEKSGAEIINASSDRDVPKKIAELVPDGLDVALDCGSFHSPRTALHKVEKAMMLETDVPEVLNEAIVSVRKMGKIGITAVYAGFTNHFNIGAVMQKGIRLIGNGQGKWSSTKHFETAPLIKNIAPVHRYWHELLNDYIIPGNFDPTFVVTHRVQIEDMDKLYAAFDQHKNGIEKVFVQTKFSGPPLQGTPKLTRVDEWS